MAHEELFKLYETDKVEFVQQFLKGLGGYAVCDVEHYRLSSASYGDFHLTEVDHEGGAEGDGEYMYVVFKLTDRKNPPVHFMVTGVYNSWEASEWDDEVHIVEAQQVMHQEWVNI